MTTTMPPESLLIVRLRELKLDVQRVEQMLEGVEKQRKDLTTFSKLVRSAGVGTLGERLIEAQSTLRSLKDKLVNTLQGEVADLLDETGAKDDIDRMVEQINEHLIEVSARLRVAATRATDIGRRVENLNVSEKAPIHKKINDCLQHCSVAVLEIDELIADVGAGLDDAEAWSKYDEIVRQCRPLFTDYVDFLAGVTLRDYGFDNGVAKLADRLFDHLEVGSIAVPARQGAVETRLRVVNRFHFPEWEIWDVPLAGYHAGLSTVDGENVGVHSVIKRAMATHPETFTSEELAGKLFADVYAARLVGPAYACALLLLHLHPRKDTVRSGHCPSAIDRAYVVLATLRSYDSVGGFSKIVDRLSSDWSSAVGGEERARPADAEVLDDFVARILNGPLKGGIAKYNVPYGPTRWDVATETVTTAADLAGKPVLDQLNAAWYLRIKDPGEAPYVTAMSEGGGPPLNRTRAGQVSRGDVTFHVRQSSEHDHGQ